MEKYEKYSTQDGEEQRIDLHKNFRSREEVLTGANKLFSCLMTRRMGGIVYDEDAALNPGAEYPETHGENRSELLLLDLEEDPEGAAEAEENERELEARMVGTKILEMVGKQKNKKDKDAGKQQCTASFLSIFCGKRRMCNGNCCKRTFCRIWCKISDASACRG